MTSSSDNQPRHTKNDGKESNAISVLGGLLDLKKVYPMLKADNQTKDIDGYIKLLDGSDKDSNLGTIEVQVRTLAEKYIDPPKYSGFKVEALNYADTTRNPVLLIVVDIKNKVAYWKHLTKNIIKQGQKSTIIKFKKSNIIGKQNKQYIKDWEKLWKQSSYKKVLDTFKPDEFERLFSIKIKQYKTNFRMVHYFKFTDERAYSKVRWDNAKTQFVPENSNKKYTASEAIHNNDSNFVVMIGEAGDSKSSFSLQILKKSTIHQLLTVHVELPQYPSNFQINDSNTDIILYDVSCALVLAEERWFNAINFATTENKEEFSKKLQNYLKKQTSLIIFEGINEFQGKNEIIFESIKFGLCWKCTNVQVQDGKNISLSLTYLDSSSLPGSLEKFIGLHTLDLWDNDLTSLPISLNNFTKLQSIELGANKLSSLSESFCKLAKLQTLNLRNNKLSSLPTSFFKLAKLQTLNLRENELSSLPESFCKLVKLQTLNLGDNKLSSLPESFHKLVKLQRLDLRGNELSSLPESFCKLAQLQNLDLGNNKLSSLPESFCKLVQLQALNLGDIELISLPESLKKTIRLQVLDLHRNKRSSLFERLNKLIEPYGIDLRQNKRNSLFESLNELIEPYSLDLRQNKRSSLLESLKNILKLRSQYLRQNKLSSLSESFGKLVKLQRLGLGGNNFSSLPESFSKLIKLQSLDLGGNNLSSLPDCFCKLAKLEMLDLGDNNLSSLPKDFSKLSKLQGVYLSNNELSLLPEGFFIIKSLKIINLENNKLNSISKNINIYQMINLKGNDETLFSDFFDRVKNQKSKLPLVDFEVQNFKSIKSEKVNFDTYSCYIGDNASGKSNFVKSLQFLRDILIKGLESSISEYGGSSNILMKQASLEPVIKFFYSGFLGDESVNSKGEQILLEEYCYKLELKILPEYNVNVVTEILEIKVRQDSRIYGIRYVRINNEEIQVLEGSNFKIVNVRLKNTLMLREISDLPIVSVKDLLSGIRFYDFDTNQIKKDVKFEHSKVLKEDGSNLASIIQSMNSDKDKTNMDDLSAYLRHTLQFVTNVDTKIAERGRIDLSIIEKYYPEGSISSPDISDGTISMVAFIVALFFQPETRFIVFEEPERYIHPGLIHPMVKLLKNSTQLLKGKKQLLLTTHSPLFLKFLDFSKISHVTRDETGSTIIKKVETIETVKNLIKSEFEMHEILEENLI